MSRSCFTKKAGACNVPRAMVVVLVHAKLLAAILPQYGKHLFAFIWIAQ